jgi:hypothetical protein
MDKLGSPVDPEDVQDGGNHGVWNGLAAIGLQGEAMHLSSLDAPCMRSIAVYFRRPAAN